VISYYAPSFDGKYVVAGIPPLVPKTLLFACLIQAQDTKRRCHRPRTFGSPSWMHDNRSFSLQPLAETHA